AEGTAAATGLTTLSRLAGDGRRWRLVAAALGRDACPDLLALGVGERRRGDGLGDLVTTRLQLGHDLGHGAGLVGGLEREPAYGRRDAFRLRSLIDGLLRERDLRARDEEVVHEVVTGLAQLGQVGGDAAVLVGEGEGIGLVDPRDATTTTAPAAEEPTAPATSAGVAAVPSGTAVAAGGAVLAGLPVLAVG